MALRGNSNPDREETFFLPPNAELLTLLSPDDRISYVRSIRQMVIRIDRELMDRELPDDRRRRLLDDRYKALENLMELANVTNDVSLFDFVHNRLPVSDDERKKWNTFFGEETSETLGGLHEGRDAFLKHAWKKIFNDDGRYNLIVRIRAGSHLLRLGDKSVVSKLKKMLIESMKYFSRDYEIILPILCKIGDPYIAFQLARATEDPEDNYWIDRIFRSLGRAVSRLSPSERAKFIKAIDTADGAVEPPNRVYPVGIGKEEYNLILRAAHRFNYPSARRYDRDLEADGNLEGALDYMRALQKLYFYEGFAESDDPKLKQQGLVYL